MDKIEGEIPDSDEVLLPGEASAPVEETAGDEVERAKAAVDLFADEKASNKRPPYLAIGGAIGVVAILLGLAWSDLLNVSTAIYIIGLALIPLVLWAGRRTSTVYTVFLGCIIAALLTCVYCLWSVLAKYYFDVKAQEAKQRVVVTQPVDRGWLAEANNTLADC